MLPHWASIGRGIKTWCFHGFTLSCMCVSELQCMCLDTHTGTHTDIFVYISFYSSAVAISHRCIPTGSENNSHQAISNLPFLSKIIEKAVYQQLNNYLLLSNEYIYISPGDRYKHWGSPLNKPITGCAKIGCMHALSCVTYFLFQIIQLGRFRSVCLSPWT